jgi:hypothetical protein
LSSRKHPGKSVDLINVSLSLVDTSQIGAYVQLSTKRGKLVMLEELRKHLLGELYCQFLMARHNLEVDALFRVERRPAASSLLPNI